MTEMRDDRFGSRGGFSPESPSLGEASSRGPATEIARVLSASPVARPADDQSSPGLRPTGAAVTPLLQAERQPRNGPLTSSQKQAATALPAAVPGDAGLSGPPQTGEGCREAAVMPLRASPLPVRVNEDQLAALTRKMFPLSQMTATELEAYLFQSQPNDKQPHES